MERSTVKKTVGLTTEPQRPIANAFKVAEPGRLHRAVAMPWQATEHNEVQCLASVLLLDKRGLLVDEGGMSGGGREADAQEQATKAIFLPRQRTHRAV